MDIKFRGRRLNGGWIHGALIPTEFSWWGVPSIADKNFRYEVKPDTICPYTGYKDVDGKEIYEGDVLRLLDERDIEGNMVVLFGENEGTLWGRENYGFYVTFTCAKLNERLRQDFLFWLRKGVKVVGNIHDNPELMVYKEEKES